MTDDFVTPSEGLRTELSWRRSLSRHTSRAAGIRRTGGFVRLRASITKRRAATLIPERGTSTPGMATSAVCSSYRPLGPALEEMFAPIWLSLESNYSEPGSYTVVTGRGVSGEQRKLVG